MDYDTLIDRETWDFINRTTEYYPPDATGMSVADQRQVYNDLCRAFFQGYPPGLVVDDQVIAGVPVRTYEKAPSDAVVIYFHGGGFVVGGLDSHDDVCAEICDLTGFRVVSVDYRLSPEHKHPAAFEDALAVCSDFAFANPDKNLVLAGDSAGANLAAAVAHRTRGMYPIAGQVLIYGAFGGDVDKGSYLTHAHAPMLTRDDILYYMGIRFEDGTPNSDPTAAPLYDTNFANLPPSILISAECDPISDDSRDYAERISAAGGQALWINEKGLVHGYLRGRKSVRRAQESFARIVRAIDGFGRGLPFPPSL